MKKYIGMLTVIAALAVPATFNSCDANHGDGVASLASSSACLMALEPGATPIYSYVRTRMQCATCHYNGTSSAPQNYYFADGNPSLGLQGLANVVQSNAQKFFDKAYDPSHFGGAGPQHQAGLEPLKSAFMTSASDYMVCLSSAGGGVGGNLPVSLEPTVRTIAKPIPANQSATLNILWDLSTEIQTPNVSLPGAQFRITIQGITSQTGSTYYYVTSPQARGATNGAIHIRNIRVYFNGSLLALNNGGGTWTSLSNLAPSSRLHALASGTGTMIIPADITSGSNTIAIGFGSIEVSKDYPDFNPTTYARLTSNNNNTAPVGERVFQQRCQNCHNATQLDGNMNLGAGNNLLQQLKLSSRVVPFDPMASAIYQRVTLPAGNPAAMPATGGPLSNEEIRWIRDWILDGAP